ncbi:fumarylacetoacetate hydrolase family protein [Celeribacter indicus]|uniref:Fumarylacetoacetate (FAA) hydrolase n=1 Tax=Celeribacter indicus TaxID=1208324 RepID=A0A0B5DNT7_9RHOB|nr:fumarylacetoacetate hydrolase family protein [Celeribacter indicus]AJE44884.1 fumarylacetoacetate (FAA) hydrolase [Celeribacter indicus]SDX22782.1 acylpyruvate hydrolase [Celeribacter indicus]
MKLVTLDCVPGGQPGAVLESGEILHLARAAAPGTAETWLPPRLRDILAAGQEGLDLVRRIVERVEGLDETERHALRAQGGLLPADTRLLAPLPDPNLIVSVGQAYRSHVAEMKGNLPKEPHGFLKSPTVITGPEAEIALPPQAADLVDFEGELCVVIGRTCHNVTEAEAMRYVAGYTVTNDLSARDAVPMIGAAKTTPDARVAWDHVHMDKQYPGFAPMGPVMVTADEIADPGDLTLTTRVNGAVMQQANTSDFIFPVARVISYFSHWYTLRPGDIISTGTPGGVGYGRDPKVLLRPGDVVEVEVSRVGTLRNRFVAKPH